MTDRSQKEIATMEGKHFDIGLMGMWYGLNYGSVMTYYALNTILKKMGYSVLMIDKHYSEKDYELNDQLHSRKFAKEHYDNFFPAILKEEHEVLNDYCDTFVVGSDQVWNYGVAKNFGRNFYFGFVADDKRKISYGSSFGHGVSFTPMSELPEITSLLQRFDAISVREDDAVNVLKDEFGIEGTQVLDPVFMLTKEEYQILVEESTINEDEKYMLAYILNPTPEIRDMLLHISEKKGLKLIVILDGNKYKRPEFAKELNLPNIVEGITTQDWLKYIQNAECVITDSCHGASFTLLFERPLICLGNTQRGMSRFYSLTKLFEISNRLFTEPEKVKEHMELVDSMGYNRIRKIMQMERERSGKWLKNALETPKILEKNIKCIPKKECCGCGACYNSCPVDAITMEYDEEGFLYPVINEEKCINCKKCQLACPALHAKMDYKKVPECYAAYGSDEIRSVSSSGGIFSMVAEEILKVGGAVCGAAFDEKQNLSQKVIYDEKDMPALRGSKYIQSNTKKTYREIKKVLEEGKPALYVGCPCQIAGLRTFLNKDYDNLFTMDLLCHGGPSPVIFQKYLKEVHGDKDVVYVGFRDKEYFGWTAGMAVKYANGRMYRKEKMEDSYYRSFLPCTSVRPHCQVCHYAALPRQGDFTVGDFWGVQKYDPKLTDGKGTSILSVNSEKGVQMVERLREKFELLEKIDINHILTHGQPYARPYRNNPRRYRLVRMTKDCSYKKAIECCVANRFDYALYGMNGDSYEDILGYFALYKMMARLNYSVLMVPRAKEIEGEITPLKYRMHTFANRYYPTVSRVDSIHKFFKLNETCSNMMVGPGKTWDNKYGELLSFAAEKKKKLYYERLADSAFSPMFLLEKEDCDVLVEHATVELPEKYTVVYVQKQQEELIKQLKKNEHEVVVLTQDEMIEDWIASVRNSDCIITDSMDAVVMAILYQKRLVLLPGKIKQEQLLQLNLQKYVQTDVEEIVNMFAVAENTEMREQEVTIEEYRLKMKKKLGKKLKYRKPLREKLSYCKRKVIGAVKNHMPASVKVVVKKILKRQ